MLARNSMENVVATFCLVLGVFLLIFHLRKSSLSCLPLSLSVDDAYLCEMLAKVPGTWPGMRDTSAWRNSCAGNVASDSDKCDKVAL